MLSILYLPLRAVSTDSKIPIDNSSYFFIDVPLGYATQKCTHNRMVYDEIDTMYIDQLVFGGFFVNFHSVLKL